MQLDFLTLDRLAVSKANMRACRKPPDVSDLLPTMRKRGVLVPLIVRPAAQTEDGADPRFEIVAGARRFHAARTIAAETGTSEPLPCAILAEGDDADAIEASMIENLARLDADEVTQWENFVRLVKEGRTVADIAATFGLPDLAVRRVLALGNLTPRIRSLYRREAIDAATVRQLTLASKSQQKAWLALYDDPQAYCPTGYHLKAWLFGGQSVPVAHALFDVEESGLATIADLFGEDAYFADAEAFWTAQNAALAARREAYIDAGWADMVIVPPTDYFHQWEYERSAKRKGGRVYADVRASGEVVFHEGFLTAKEARRAERGEEPASERPKRPELTGPLTDYVDLHRHAAVRAELVEHPALALRLLVAHAVGGSHLVRFHADPQTARNDATRESLETSKGEAAFDAKRRAVLGILGFDPDEPTVTGGNGDPFGLVGVFLRLARLTDEEVLSVAAVVMGEALAVGSAALEAVGELVGLDMAAWWEADEAFLALLRDREVTEALVGDAAGEKTRADNAGEKAKTLKIVLADTLAGTNGRTKREGWVPKWMAFPPAAYTTRGGVATVEAAALVAAAREAAQEDAQAVDETHREAEAIAA